MCVTLPVTLGLQSSQLRRGQTSSGVKEVEGLNGGPV